MNPDLKLKYPEECYMSVIGVDNKHHVALMWSETTCCGVKVKTKKEEEMSHEDYPYSCYECTY